MALSPKCYMAYNEETEEQKLGSKGVPRNAKLELDHYLARLYQGQEHFVDVRSLRLVKSRMARTKMKKTALNDLFMKFAVQNDHITCFPLSEDGKILYPVNVPYSECVSKTLKLLLEPRGDSSNIQRTYCFSITKIMKMLMSGTIVSVRNFI